MIYLHDAIYALNSSVVVIRGEKAFDKDDNLVEYDLSAAESKLIEMQAEEEAKVQAAIDTKNAALNKLMALGLTEEEALALGK